MEINIEKELQSLKLLPAFLLKFMCVLYGVRESGGKGQEHREKTGCVKRCRSGRQTCSGGEKSLCFLLQVV